MTEPYAEQGGVPSRETPEFLELAALNEPQAAAVAHVEGPLLIFAGAGSGKTRVIVYRIANLVAVHRVAPYRILAVTFTNKAAGEMKARLEGMVGAEVTKDLWVGTFHAVCVRLLRRYHEAAGLGRNFVIYDDGDQRTVMNRVVKELKLDDKRFPPRQVLARIHAAKQEGKGPEHVAYEAVIGPVIAQCFEAYQRHLKEANAVDFDDILLCVLRLLEDTQSIASKELTTRFRYVLVDEFQDVNQVQYRLVKALSSSTQNLCVVGDDDQSIYRWRGADVRIVRGFRRDFPSAKVVKLEQNYRSTANVVTAALGVIKPAGDREPKELWTSNKAGEPVRVVACDSEHDEAAFVVDRIRNAVASGISPRDIAVFYRVHAQSRVLEEVLLAERIPYQIIGGMRFFERAEVKDILSYLRVVSNPKSDVDLMRIINQPPRKIGGTTVDRLVLAADEARISVFEAVERVAESTALGSAARNALARFNDMMQGLLKKALELAPSELARHVIDASGYGDMLKIDESAEAETRLQNLTELVGSIVAYEQEMDAAGEAATLAGYLERVTLQSDADTVEEKPRVVLMTVHAAKGLEFDTVLITGMEEELFPFKSQDPKRGEDLEEERRLAYVAITRARRLLYVTYASRRMIFGTTRYGIASRFIGDMPSGSIAMTTTPALTGFKSARKTAWEAPVSRGPRAPWSHPQASAAREMGFMGSPARSAVASGASGATGATGASSGPSAPVRAPGERYVERDEPSSSGGDGLFKGARVEHKTFGVGTVLAVDGSSDPTVTVKFSGHAPKAIKARFLRMPGS